MMLNKNCNKSSGVYISQDPINNFKFRVTLKKLDSLIKIPSFDLFQETIEEKDEIETITLNWQQKILSDFEIEYYSSIENCKTNIHKKYNEIIINNNLMEKLKNKKHSIFTYNQTDNFDPEENEVENKTHKSRTHEEFMLKKINDENLDDTVIKMYIMAALKSKEIILFKITWCAYNKLLIIYPDINNIDKTPYFIEIDSDSRDLYYYSIQNISKTKLKTDDMKLSRLTLENIDNLEKTDNFLYPPTKLSKHVLFLFEIITLECFEYSNCHVRYVIVLPDYTNLIEGDLESSTHSSYKSTTENEWRIGYCFEIFISADVKDVENLKIYFEVISIDMFGRERLEGRSYTSVACYTSIKYETLQCYRELKSTSLLEKISRFFIGGIYNFDYIAYNGDHSTRTDSISRLNRYGNKTLTTGSIKIKYQVMIQHHPKLNFLLKKTIKKSKLVNTTFSEIENIVSNYFDAKKRFENAKVVN